MAHQAWKQGLDWWIRLPDGTPVNLNTPQGASMVTDLQQQVAQLEAQAAKGKRRKKVGPSETKG